MTFLPCYTSVFLFFPLREINRLTQIRLRTTLGTIYYFDLFFLFQIPFISPYFKHFQGVSALRIASALATENEEKEGEKEKISHTLLHSHTARALCPDSGIMREKRIEREGERYRQR